MATILLDQIKKSEEIQNALDLLYDFTLISPTTDSTKRGFLTDQAVLCIATDACGGTYALLGEGDVEKKPLVYVSSEGQAGVLAPSFNAFMNLLITMPFWLDVLKFSGGGKLAEMKKAYALLQSEVEADMNELLEDDGDRRSYKAVQKWLQKNLSLNELKSPVETLFEAVSNGIGFKAFAKKDKRPYENLFSRYVVTDNPMWRKGMKR